MRRLLTSMLTGLVLALALLGLSFVADGTGTFHWLRDIFIGPPRWLLVSGLPSLSPALTVQHGGPYGGAAFFMLFFVLFWFLVCSGALLVVRRRPPNNSSKPTPLRGVGKAS